MLKNYLSHVEEREALGIPPLPLDAKQTQALTELLEKPNNEIEDSYLLDLLINRIPPGVDQASCCLTRDQRLAYGQVQILRVWVPLVLRDEQVLFEAARTVCALD